MGNLSQQGNHRGLPLRETAITRKTGRGVNYDVPVGAGPRACPVGGPAIVVRK